MNIINLSIDVTVAKKVVEKRVVEEEQFSLRKLFQFFVLLCIQLWPVPRFDRELLDNPGFACQRVGCQIIALRSKAARYMYKSLGD